MESKVKFEDYQSTENVNFLDATFKIKNGKISTRIFSEPTYTHIYLNASSCHPEHLIKNKKKYSFYVYANYVRTLLTI